MSYPPCYEIIVVIRCSFDKYGRRLDLSRGQQAQLLRETGAAVHALVTSPPPKPFLQGLLGSFGVSLPHVSYLATQRARARHFPSTRNAVYC